MITIEVLLKSLAGLGLLFFSIKMVTRNLSAMAGDKLRRKIEKISHNTILAVMFGAAAGFVTQSGRTASFIMASFVQAKLIDVRRALPVVLWSNFGCTLVIFAAILPINLVALVLLAAAGVSVAFEQPKSLLNAASAVFGLALMLFGLQMMSSSVIVMSDYSWFSAALNFIKLSLIFAFFMGFALTLVAQSHLAIMLIAVSLAAKGVFSFDQTLMVILGAQVGSSVITYLTGIHFRGQPRQVVMAQVLYNLGGVALFLALFVGGRALTGGDPLAALTHELAPSPGAQAATFALLFNTVTPLLLTAALPLFEKLCARLTPSWREDDLAQPQFLHAEIGENAAATLVLAEQEQLGLLRRLPTYCASLRGEPVLDTPRAASVHHDAFVKISRHIDHFQKALMSRQMGPEDTEWLLNQQKRQELLNAIEETCYELWQVSKSIGVNIEPLRHDAVEALDLLLLSAIEAMANSDPEELDLLDALTNNHGATMERVRKRHLAISDRLAPDERNHILQITSLLERAAWAVRRFGGLLRESPDMAPSSSTSPAFIVPGLEFQR